MTLTFKKFDWLIIALCLSGTLAAEENSGTTPRKNEQLADKLQSAPSGPVKIPQQVGNIPGAKPASLEPPKPRTTESENAAAVEKSPPVPPAPRVAPAGRRDPFRPFTLNARSSSGRRRENLSPLERFELGQLKLVAVISNTKEPTAMVEDSSGLGYLVKVGTPIGINDGKVTAIERGGIIIEEFFVDLYGARKKHQVNMRLSVENAG